MPFSVRALHPLMERTSAQLVLLRLFFHLIFCSLIVSGGYTCSKITLDDFVKGRLQRTKSCHVLVLTVIYVSFCLSLFLTKRIYARAWGLASLGFYQLCLQIKWGSGLELLPLNTITHNRRWSQMMKTCIKMTLLLGLKSFPQLCPLISYPLLLNIFLEHFRPE